ncbi:MAG: ATP-dependent metallopeptidase FtsH/Yme1/Tma family protein [Chloroflexi bacterium]|nr:ATP-dependent metallopeptidase FtsH/Yme1/Tma family protein [Chloroflexota bacterium]
MNNNPNPNNNPNQPNGSGGPAAPGGSRGLLLLAVLIVGVILLFFISSQFNASGQEITLPDLAEAIRAGEVESITVQGDDITAVLNDQTEVQARKESVASFYDTMSLLGVEEAQLQPPTGPEITIQGPNTLGFVFLNILPFVFMIALFGWLAFAMMRSMRGSQDQAMNFGRSRAKMVNIDKPMVTFEDVAGVEESKTELEEIVEFLKDPEKFIRLGARVPKGVLMIGPPGTGKNLLARAVAGEAGVPFMNISGSDFVEMFVGVGASRVRDLFEKARQVAPCIIFIDEIDAVGRMRGTGLGGGHDEREQTLNQILVEMDGFDNETNIIVIAATNRSDILDPALMRPGRFDRKVYVDRPDVAGREKILEVHTRGKPLRVDVDLQTLAKLTPGFSGADLENLVNEGAILAARRNLAGIGMSEFQEAMEKMAMGPERRSRVITPAEKQVLAYHEAGHALAAYFSENADPVHKITIVPRGRAGGYMMSLPESMDNALNTRSQLFDKIVVAMGGRAAEEVVFNQITTGASNDLERATGLARAMVTRLGMSDRLGLRVFGEDENTPFLGRSLGSSRDYSEESARQIDHEISQIIDAAYERAKTILLDNRDKMDALVDLLMEIETVARPEFEAVMAGQRPSLELQPG